MAWDPAGARIATACDDGTVRVFEVGREEPVQTYMHGGEVLSVAWDPAGTGQFAFGSSDQNVAVVAPRPGRLWWTPGVPREVAFADFFGHLSAAHLVL